MIDTGMSHIGFRCIIRAVEGPPQEEVSAGSSSTATEATIDTQAEDLDQGGFQTVQDHPAVSRAPSSAMARESGRRVCGPLCCQSYPDHPQLHPDYRADGRRAGGHPVESNTSGDMFLKVFLTSVRAAQTGLANQKNADPGNGSSSEFRVLVVPSSRRHTFVPRLSLVTVVRFPGSGYGGERRRSHEPY